MAKRIFQEDIDYKSPKIRRLIECEFEEKRNILPRGKTYPIRKSIPSPSAILFSLFVSPILIKPAAMKTLTRIQDQYPKRRLNSLRERGARIHGEFGQGISLLTGFPFHLPTPTLPNLMYI